MGDKYYLNERDEFFEPKRTAGIIAGVLAAIFGIVFVIMLMLYLIDCTQDRNIGNIFIYDLSGSDWTDNEDLAIFYNEEFGSNTVAPYSKGVYKFMFRNDSDYTLKYEVELTEENEYDIALCYKLERDGAYLVDDYTRADDFECSGVTIEANSTHYFELEWYWDGNVSDVNDTLAGLNSSIYTLTITMSATAIS